MQVIFHELSQNILRVNDCRVPLYILSFHPITIAKREKAAGYPKQFLNSCSQVPLTNYFSMDINNVCLTFALTALTNGKGTIIRG